MPNRVSPGESLLPQGPGRSGGWRQAPPWLPQGSQPLPGAQSPTHLYLHPCSLCRTQPQATEKVPEGQEDKFLWQVSSPTFRLPFSPRLGDADVQENVTDSAVSTCFSSHFIARTDSSPMMAETLIFPMKLLFSMQVRAEPPSGLLDLQDLSSSFPRWRLGSRGPGGTAGGSR